MVPCHAGVASLSSFRRALLSLGSEPCVSHLAPEISSSSSVKWDCCPYLVAPSCLTLGTPMDVAHQAPGILQAETQWAAGYPPRIFPDPGDRTPCLLHLLHWQRDFSLLSHQGGL